MMINRRLTLRLSSKNRFLVILPWDFKSTGGVDLASFAPRCKHTVHPVAKLRFDSVKGSGHVSRSIGSS